MGVATGGGRGCHRQLEDESGGRGLGEADMGVQGAMARGLQNQTLGFRVSLGSDRKDEDLVLSDGGIPGVGRLWGSRGGN